MLFLYYKSTDTVVIKIKEETAEIPLESLRQAVDNLGIAKDITAPIEMVDGEIGITMETEQESKAKQVARRSKVSKFTQKVQEIKQARYDKGAEKED